MHIAAEVVVDALELPEKQEYAILHLRHPRPLPWMTMMKHFSGVLRVPIRPYLEWLGKLAAVAAGVTDPKTAKQISPALALLDHFRAIEVNPALPTDPAKENNGMSTLLDVEYSCRQSERLRFAATRQFTIEDVEEWVAYWKKTGAIA